MKPKYCQFLFYGLVSLLLLGCAGGNKLARDDSQMKSSPRPAWVGNHPSSPTHFIGIGSAPVGSDLSLSQERAKLTALKDISSQIEIAITADTKLYQSNVTTDTESKNFETFRKNIRSYTEAVLQGWEIAGTWQDPAGYYWCKIVLDKQKYYDRMNKKINDAIALAIDGINASKQGPFDARLQALYKGMRALDDFPGDAVKGVVDGRETILNAELPRRIQALLSSIEIRSSTVSLALGATAPIPDTLGATVLFEGNPDPAISLAWSTSNAAVQAQNLPTRPDGLHPVSLNSLPASAGKVRVTATLDCGEFGYDLLLRRYTLPSASFTISRETPKIFLTDAGGFGKQVLERLTSRSGAAAAKSRAEADFILSANCVTADPPVMSMNLFRAKAEFTLLVTRTDGGSVVDCVENVSAADGQSGERAQASAEKLALEKAVKKIEEAF